jgi:hypothetical protein
MPIVRTLHAPSAYSRLIMHHDWRKRCGLYWFIVLQLEGDLLIVLSNTEGELAPTIRQLAHKVIEMEMEPTNTNSLLTDIMRINTKALPIIAAGALHVYRSVVESYDSDQELWDRRVLWAPSFLDTRLPNVRLNDAVQARIEEFLCWD